MKPRILIESAVVPGGDELHLWEHDGDFVIMTGRDELMNSRAHDSEDALAQRASARLGARVGQRVLVGGLGMGFTAAAALRELGPDGEIVVAELVSAVVDWNRGPLAALTDGVLDDPRVQVVVADVGAVLREQVVAFDQILLDVDNGPADMCSAGNAWLYGAKGLRAAHKALRPGGILAIWSAVRDEEFTKRLQAAGFNVELEHLRAHRKRGTHHYIWFAHKDG